MNLAKKGLLLLINNVYTRLLLSCALAFIGSVFGTDGQFEIESLRVVFDVVAIIGWVFLGIHALVMIASAFYHGLGFGYQPGDYNKWRDGDFDEWKKKNNFNGNWFEKFIDWFQNPLKQ